MAVAVQDVRDLPPREFADTVKYPDDDVSDVLDEARMYADEVSGMPAAVLDRYHLLVAAHILSLNGPVGSSGTPPGMRLSGYRLGPMSKQFTAESSPGPGGTDHSGLQLQSTRYGRRAMTLARKHEETSMVLYEDV